MVREKIIKNLIQNKEVLDIGSVGQTDLYSLWDVYSNSSLVSLTGIDVEEAKETAISKFKKKFFNTDSRIIVGNMESFQFDKQFDVIVAGDVIEHVDNQGLFLSNIKKHLKANGKLIITTPNAKWPTVFLKPNETHSLWHDKYTLTNILTRNCFVVEKIIYYPGNKKRYPLFKKFLALNQAMIVICSKNGL
jgi:2-polyprenyl-3-methyl-5-hydroxy-6-metoxy-1,4-benzoquinol methylase